MLARPGDKLEAEADAVLAKFFHPLHLDSFDDVRCEFGLG